MNELSKNCKITEAVTVTNGASGTSAIEGAIIDMSGWEGVLVIVTMGAITSGGVQSIEMQQGAAAAMGDAADLLGTNVAIADDDDEETFYIDLYRPLKRYVRLYVNRSTQASTVAAATYIQYGPRVAPYTQVAPVSGETHISPAEGTA
jgi:hypothetical protein